MSAVWTATPAGTRLLAIRADLDAQAGIPLEYDATIDGAYALVAARLAADVDQGVALALSTQILATAPGPNVVARALDAGLPPRPGAASRYTLRVQCTGTVEIPQGTRVRGGGPLGRSTWAVVDETDTYVNTDFIVVEAEDLGPLAIDDGTYLTLIDTVTGVESLYFVAAYAGPFTLGTDPESLPELRARVGAERGSPGSAPGIKAALEQIPWIEAVDVRRSGTALAVTIAPAPVGADQEAEFGDALYAAMAAETETTGASSVTVTDVNDEDLVLEYTAGSTEPVAVVVVLTSDGTVTDEDLEAAGVAAVEQYFAGLGTGDRAYRLRVLASLNLAGVTEATLTLDGTTAASIAPPTAADVLIPYPIDVSVTS